jgi:hypothetical protein
MPRTAQINSRSLLLAGVLSRYRLEEFFGLRPGLNANRDVPSADTYNSAQMQLGIDKNPHFEVLGTNMTSALATHSASGGVTLTTAGASGDQGILLPHLNSAVSAWTSCQWNSSQKATFEAQVTTGANITNATIWAGFKLTNTPTVATDDNQAFFRYSDATSPYWQCVYSLAGTDYTVTTEVAVQVSTAYNLRVEFDTDRNAHFFINDVEVATTTATTTNINYIPYVGVQADAGAAKAITVRCVRASRA